MMNLELLLYVAYEIIDKRELKKLKYNLEKFTLDNSKTVKTGMYVNIIYTSIPRPSWLVL